MSAFSVLHSIARGLGAIPSYIARANTEWALYQQYGPDWQRQFEEEQKKRVEADKERQRRSVEHELNLQREQRYGEQLEFAKEQEKRYARDAEIRRRVTGAELAGAWGLGPDFDIESPDARRQIVEGMRRTQEAGALAKEQERLRAIEEEAAKNAREEQEKYAYARWQIEQERAIQEGKVKEPTQAELDDFTLMFAQRMSPETTAPEGVEGPPVLTDYPPEIVSDARRRARDVLISRETPKPKGARGQEAVQQSIRRAVRGHVEDTGVQPPSDVAAERLQKKAEEMVAAGRDPMEDPEIRAWVLAESARRSRRLP
jgi:hypothetical protein